MIATLCCIAGSALALGVALKWNSQNHARRAVEASNYATVHYAELIDTEYGGITADRLRYIREGTAGDEHRALSHLIEALDGGKLGRQVDMIPGEIIFVGGGSPYGVGGTYIDTTRYIYAANEQDLWVYRSLHALKV